MGKVALVAHWDWVLYNFRLPIAKALRNVGHEVVLVCPPGKYTAELENERFPVLRWEVDRRSLGLLAEGRAIQRLTDLYQDQAFDLTHHFTIKPNLYGTIAARRSRVPAIINTFSGMGFLLSDSRRAALLRLFGGPLMRSAFRSPSVWTVFQNADDLDSAVRRGWVPAEQSRLIAGSGVDVDRYTPKAEVGSSRQPVFVMAARLIKEKGVHDFVAASRAVRRSGVSARFVVAGETDPGNPSSLSQEQIETWTTEGDVEFVGHVSDMARQLAASDVAVLPTYYPEGLPRFLLEAAAAGLPLIATDIAPCRPIVREGHNGYLVPPRDPHALAAAMIRLAEDQSLRRRLGRNGRLLAVAEFREEDVVDQYLKLYDQLLGNARS